VILRHDNDAFHAIGARPSDAPLLADLGWRRHAHTADAWWTRSPYLAAPLWGARDPADAALIERLGWYAWNYETSFADAPLAGTGVDQVRVPADRALLPFQVAGVQRLLQRKKSLLADPMGTGKSCMALSVMNMIRPRRTVICCPSSLTENWAAEAQMWLVDAQSITILDGAKKTLPETGLIILPYSRAHNFEFTLAAGPPIDLMICDELHFLKDELSRRGSVILGPSGLARKAERVIGLTGTPFPNVLSEMWGCLSTMAPEIVHGMTKDRFKETYCNIEHINAKVQAKSGGTKRIKVEKLTGKSLGAMNAELRASGFMVRRNKDDVLPQLPKQNIFFVRMVPDAEIASLVREELNLYEQLQMKIMTAQELMQLRGHVARVRAQLGFLKAPKIGEYARSVFEGGEDRAVVFMLHLEAIDRLADDIRGAGVEVMTLTGRDNTTERYNRVQHFQKPGGRKAIVAQTTAAGVGLTMTASHWAILGEVHWTPSWNDQALGRCHRIGQTHPVQCPILIFPHSCEENVMRTTARKALDARSVLDDNLQRMFMEAAE
jgi:SWI/SNF-related matrix-associated actin-dependent regulator of chromatin subfamily A-like protein 1